MGGENWMLMGSLWSVGVVVLGQRHRQPHRLGVNAGVVFTCLSLVNIDTSWRNTRFSAAGGGVVRRR